MQIRPLSSLSLTVLLLLASSFPTAATTLTPPPLPSGVQMRFLPVFNVVEPYYTYIKENKERKEVNKRNMHFATNAKDIKMQARVSAAKDMQEDFAEQCYVKTLDLVLGKMTIDQYLSNYLEIRYVYLEGRTERVEKYWTETDDSKKRAFIVPTDKDLAELIMTLPDYEGLKNHNECIRKDSIRHYQLLNEIIRLAYRACSLQELSGKTIIQLRASKQLHPILNYGKSDLGHPDQAGGYAGVMPMLNELCKAYKGVANKQKLDVQEIVQALRKQQQKLNVSQNDLVKVMHLVIKELEIKLEINKAWGKEISNLIPLIHFFFSRIQAA